MLSWLPSIEYPPSGQGYWSPVTSTINWCEEASSSADAGNSNANIIQDYYATVYAAEIVNTLTNLTFVVLAVRGIRSCYKDGHDQIFLVTFVGYLAVGLGSLAFHASLKYPMQLVDELSMIYTTAFSCYASFSYNRSKLVSFCIGLFLTSLAIFITAYYHYLQDPSFHQNAYALLTATVIFRSMYVMEVTLRPSLRIQQQEHKTLHNSDKSLLGEKEEQQRIDKRDAHILKTMWAMIAYGLSIFLGGFVIWTLDNVHCSRLRRWRREIGLPWGLLLEGHGWWHLMTGVGAYFFITWAIWLRHCLNGKQDQYEIVWPRLVTSLPLVVRKQPSKVSSLTNGASKKAS